MMDYAGHLA